MVICIIFILIILILLGPLWINLLDINYKFYKYYSYIDEMIFYKGDYISIIHGHTKDSSISISWFEHTWRLVLKSNFLEFVDMSYGVNPFKNYWYNKITKLISSKKIYSYYEYMEYRDTLFKLEQRNLLLNKILNS